MFKIIHVKCDASKLDIKHEIVIQKKLNKIFSPFIYGKVRHQISKIYEMKILSKLIFSCRCYGIFHTHKKTCFNIFLTRIYTFGFNLHAIKKYQQFQLIFPSVKVHLFLNCSHF